MLLLLTSSFMEQGNCTIFLVYIPPTPFSLPVSSTALYIILKIFTFSLSLTLLSEFFFGLAIFFVLFCLEKIYYIPFELPVRPSILRDCVCLPVHNPSWSVRWNP